jgi:hypothetical protein
MHVTQSLAKSGQAIDSSGTRIGRQISRRRQTFREAHGLPNSVDDRELPVPQLTDDHVKTVGTEVNGSDDLR